MNYTDAKGSSELDIERQRLELAKSEYNRQVDDFKNLDLKGSFLIAVIIASLSILTGVIQPIKSLSAVKKALYIFILILSAVCFVGSIFSILAIKLAKLDVKPIFKATEDDYTKFVKQLAISYKNYVEKNVKRYKTKRSTYNVTCILTAINIILMFIFKVI